MSKKLTQEKAIQNIKNILGDSILLDKFEYNGRANKAMFGCIKHGYWETTYANIIHRSSSSKCPTCSGRNKITEDVKKEIIEARKNKSHIILDKFIFKGYKEKSIFGCSVNFEEHGYWETDCRNVVNGSGCPKCVGRNKTTEEAKKEIIETHGDNILLDRFEYNGAIEFSWFGCPIHGYWEANFSNVKRGYGCPDCGDIKMGLSHRMTQEEAENTLKSVHGDKILLDRFIYNGRHERVLVGCKKHGYWSADYGCVASGHWCKNCHTETVAFSQEEAESNIRKKFGNSILLDKFVYKNNLEDVWVGCLTHGYRKTTYQNIMSSIGNGCLECGYYNRTYNKKLTQKEAEQKIYAIHGSSILFDEFVFKSTHSKSTFICGVNVDHGSWTVPVGCILSGSICPKCSRERLRSFGEDEADRILAKNFANEYESEKILEGCIYKQPLWFDFFIKKFNVCIEINGKQHYEPIEWFGGIESFETQKIRDFIKVEYCKKMSIKLLVIRYDENIFEKMSEFFLKEFNVVLV
jgi:hypothetical protein